MEFSYRFGEFGYFAFVDLGENEVDELSCLSTNILEMIYRGLYHFSVAHSKSKANNLLLFCF